MWQQEQQRTSGSHRAKDVETSRRSPFTRSAARAIGVRKASSRLPGGGRASGAEAPRTSSTSITCSVWSTYAPTTNSNYYEGFSGEALEEEVRRSTTWDRPSCPSGLARNRTHAPMRGRDTAIRSVSSRGTTLWQAAAREAAMRSATPAAHPPKVPIGGHASDGSGAARDHGYAQTPLQGVGQTPPSRRQWRGQGGGRTVEIDQRGLYDTQGFPEDAVGTGIEPAARQYPSFYPSVRQRSRERPHVGSPHLRTQTRPPRREAGHDRIRARGLRVDVDKRFLRSPSRANTRPPVMRRIFSIMRPRSRSWPASPITAGS